jgi:hypothetical protein
MNTLLDRPPWYVLGALMGLVVIGAFALLNERVGVLGGFSDVVERVTGRRAALGWKAWFAIGIVGGALAFRLLAGGSSVEHGYGWLIGFGAKMAGGCTSGNGLGGCSAGSPASLVATGTFMGTAIAVSFAIKAIT